MKRTKTHFSKSLFYTALLSSISAQATLTPTIERGDKNIYFTSPRGVQEVCVIPKHYDNAKYSKKDLKTEQELCSYSFYKLSEAEKNTGLNEAAICAKLNSTNPGINIFETSDELTKEYLEGNGCKDKESKKIGKYKNSTSCSYTPSIIGYYHVSRILGGIGRVPPAVLRSMDIKTHLKIASDGTSKTKSGDLINQTWSSLKNFLSAGLNGTKKDVLLTDDGEQSYGAFTTNPKKEEFYGEFFTKGPDRAIAFRENNSIFKLVKKQQPLNTFVGSDWNQQNVQTLMQMNDMTEFILLDHLLDQQDRFGNIAYQYKYAYLKHDTEDTADIDFEIDGLKKEDYDKDKSKGLVVADKTPLLVKSMILKDNDCGVSKTNVVKQAQLLKHIAHMNPKTYQKLLEFQKSILENKKFFTSNLMFTNTDYNELVANVNDAVHILKTNCNSGALRLDLNIKKYLTTGEISSGSCELKE